MKIIPDKLSQLCDRSALVMAMTVSAIAVGVLSLAAGMMVALACLTSLAFGCNDASGYAAIAFDIFVVLTTLLYALIKLERK